ncbi:hypothetical protein Droror1_Dr00028096 [Drosera rotundifolia]
MDQPLLDLAIAPVPAEVRDFKVYQYWDNQQGWRWDWLDHLLPQAILRRIAAIRPWSNVGISDSLTCSGSVDGRFRIGWAYRSLAIDGADIGPLKGNGLLPPLANSRHGKSEILCLAGESRSSYDHGSTKTFGVC